MSTGQLIGIARVSSVGQSLENQIQALNAIGCNKIYQGKLSGKSNKHELMLDEVLDYAREGDTVVTAKLDRLGRTTMGVLKFINELTEKGIKLKVLDQNISIDKTDPMSKLLVTVLAMFAEMERDLIVSRCADGRQAKIDQGVDPKLVNGGRKPKISTIERNVIRERIAQNESCNKLAKEFKVTRQAIYLIRDEVA